MQEESETEKELGKLFHKLDTKVLKALVEYNLIQDGDHILIGLSGGKDSLALVDLLGRRQRIFRPRFTVTAAHIVMRNIPYSSDLDYLTQHCKKSDISLVVKETEFDATTDIRKSPCFLCSWYRRKALFEIAKEIGCNKIAFGHHQDDILQTLLMNMTFQGAFGTMPPILKMDKFDMQLIRPLCLIAEKELLLLAQLSNYQKQKKNCPHESSSSRPEMKSVVATLEKMNPQARHNLWASMTRIQSDYLPQPKKK